MEATQKTPTFKLMRWVFADDSETAYAERMRYRVPALLV
jgi:hypothetical protein